MNALTALIERVPKQPGGSICLTCKVIEWITLYTIKWEGPGPTARAGLGYAAYQQGYTQGMPWQWCTMHSGGTTAGQNRQVNPPALQTDAARPNKADNTDSKLLNPLSTLPPPALCTHYSHCSVQQQVFLAATTDNLHSPLQVLSWPIQSKQQDLIVF